MFLFRCRFYRTTLGDPSFLTAHPTPESLVIQASCSSKGLSFPTTPADRESKKQDQLAKKVFSSGSMALKSVNAICLMGWYVHAIMELAKIMLHVPEEVKWDLRDIFLAGQCAMQQIIQAGLDPADSVARSMGTTVVMRRQAWLRGLDSRRMCRAP